MFHDIFFSDTNWSIQHNTSTMSSTSDNKKVYPLATDDLTVTILDLVQKAHQFKSVKRGANEVTKGM